MGELYLAYSSTSPSGFDNCRCAYIKIKAVRDTNKLLKTAHFKTFGADMLLQFSVILKCIDFTIKAQKLKDEVNNS